MSEIPSQTARVCSDRRGLQLAARLGFGAKGIVFATEDNLNPGKAHNAAGPQLRKRQSCERLAAAHLARAVGTEHKRRGSRPGWRGRAYALLKVF